MRRHILRDSREKARELARPNALASWPRWGKGPRLRYRGDGEPFAVVPHRLCGRQRPARRAVTLAIPDGKKTIVKCGPEVINFDQIRVGDQVKVTVAEELAVYMATDAAPPGAGAAALVVLAPKGAKPSGVVASTVQVTATVTAIDLKRHKATLQFSDGTTRTVAVREDVDLTQRKVGEKVVIRTTEVVAISVEKPWFGNGSDR